MQNERTSLAWSRTCLSFLGCSLLCAKLAPERLSGTVALLGSGTAAILLGTATRRYRRRTEVHPELEPVAVPAQVVALAAMTVVVGVAAGILVVLSG